MCVGCEARRWLLEGHYGCMALASGSLNVHPHTVPALRLAPTAQLVVEIWDWDRFTTNEKMATLRLSLKPHFLVPRERAGDPAALQKPVWYPVASTTDAGVGATMQGELLLSFQLVPKNSEKDVPPPVPSIRVRCRCPLAARCWLVLTLLVRASRPQPPMRRAYVDILALGVRSLAAYNHLPIMKPKVVFQVGDTGKSGRLETIPSKKPNGANANFLQHLTFPVDLPEDKRCVRWSAAAAHSCTYHSHHACPCSVAATCPTSRCK